jgi:hypothetical protein
MTIHVTIKPDPIVEFESLEEMERWLAQNPPPKMDWRKTWTDILEEARKRKRDAKTRIVPHRKL